MSRKNNKKIKQRYINHLKDLEKKQQAKKQQRDRNRADQEQMDKA